MFPGHRLKEKQLSKTTIEHNGGAIMKESEMCPVSLVMKTITLSLFWHSPNCTSS